MRWRAVGVVWGLAAGLAAAYAGAAFLLGLLWLYVFGDHPWPGWSSAPVLAVAVLSFLGGAVAGYLAIQRVAAPRTSGRPGTTVDRRRAVLWGGAGVAVVVAQLAWWGGIGSDRPQPTAHDRLPPVAALEAGVEEEGLALTLRLERPTPDPVEVGFSARLSGRSAVLFELRDTLPAGHADDWERAVPLEALRERARAVLLEPGFTGSASADVVIVIEGSVRVPGDPHPVHEARATLEHGFRFEGRAAAPR